MRGHVDTFTVFSITGGLTVLFSMELYLRLGIWFIPSVVIGAIAAFVVSVWIVTGTINLLNLIISCVNHWLSR